MGTGKSFRFLPILGIVVFLLLAGVIVGSHLMKAAETNVTGTSDEFWCRVLSANPLGCEMVTVNPNQIYDPYALNCGGVTRTLRISRSLTGENQFSKKCREDQHVWSVGANRTFLTYDKAGYHSYWDDLMGITNLHLQGLNCTSSGGDVSCNIDPAVYEAAKVDRRKNWILGAIFSPSTIGLAVFLTLFTIVIGRIGNRKSAGQS